MKLISCPECGKQISVNATKCVHCGFPLPLKTCPQCGAQYNAVLSVCPQCGYDEVAAKEQAEQLAKQQAEQARIAAEQHAMKMAKKKRIGMIVVVTILLVAVIGIIVGSTIYFTKKHAKSLAENIGGLVVRGDFQTATNETTALMNAWWCPKEIQNECRACVSKMNTFEEQIFIGDSLFELGRYNESKIIYDRCIQITSNREGVTQKQQIAAEYDELVNQITRFISEEDFSQAKSIAEQLYEKHEVKINKKRIDDIDNAVRKFKEEARAKRIESLAKEKRLRSTEHIYIDLGLQSRTLWKSYNEEGFFTYAEAIETFGDKLPTDEQLDELKETCDWVWNGKGYNVVGPNGRSIYLPALGFYDGDHVVNADYHGHYWSSSISYGSFSAKGLFFESKRVWLTDEYRYFGLSVRLISKN